MKIAIDAVAANKEVRAGVGTYAFQLLSAMQPNGDTAEEVELYFASKMKKHWGKLPENWKSKILSWPLPGWRTFRLGFDLLMNKPDVLFLPSSSPPPFSPKRKGATITTIHDVGFARLPKLFSGSDLRRQRKAIKKAVKKSSHLIAVSEFTKKELVDIYKLSKDKVTVTSLAVDRNIYKPANEAEITAIRKKHRLGQNYFLYVSRLDHKKNVLSLIRAFEIFKGTRGFGDPHQLVLVGPDGFGASAIKAAVAASSVKNEIRILGAVPEADKPALYSGAMGYVNVSWYEGFGLTPLEAAACGTASLISDIPAHREVMGEGAVFVSPKEPDQIAMRWKHFAEEPRKREEALALAQEKLGEYTWDKTATLTWEVLRGELAPEGILRPSDNLPI